MKNFIDLRQNIEDLTFDMAIGKVTTKNFEQYLYRLGKVVEDLIICCERLESKNAKHYLNQLYGVCLKDLDFPYTDTDSIHCEIKAPKEGGSDI